MRARAMLILGLLVACASTQQAGPPADEAGEPAASADGARRRDAATPDAHGEGNARTDAAAAGDADASGGPARGDAGDARDAARGADAGDPLAHRILARSCDEAPLADWPIEAGSTCTGAGGLAGTRYCTSGIECRDSSECVASPHGRCIGSTEQHCVYDLPRESCGIGVDCDTLPDGACLLEAVGEWCYPSGECEPRGPYCQYPTTGEGCTDDAECDALPSGRCLRAITHSRCEYFSCASDADCPANHRCLCAGVDMRCLEFDCVTDGDCPAGQRCLREDSCFGAQGGSFCTSPDDECEPGGCGAGSCAHARDRGHYVCYGPCTVP